MMCSTLWLTISEHIDATWKGCDERHHVSDQLCLWGLFFRFIEDCKSDSIISEDTVHDIWEYQRSCPEDFLTFLCEDLKLSIEVPYIFLTMTWNPGVDGTTFLGRLFDKVTMHESQESIDFRKRDSTMLSHSPKTMEFIYLVQSKYLIRHGSWRWFIPHYQNGWI